MPAEKACEKIFAKPSRKNTLVNSRFFRLFGLRRAKRITYIGNNGHKKEKRGWSNKNFYDIIKGYLYDEIYENTRN